eukprot:gene15949-11523_t
MSGRALIQLSKLAGRSAKAAASGQMGGQAEALQTVRDMAVVLPQRLEKVSAAVSALPPVLAEEAVLQRLQTLCTDITEVVAAAQHDIQHTCGKDDAWFKTLQLRSELHGLDMELQEELEATMVTISNAEGIRKTATGNQNPTLRRAADKVATEG